MAHERPSSRGPQSENSARPLRALVNDAGIQVNAPMEPLPLSEWRRLFDGNLFGHVAMTQALLPRSSRAAERLST